MIRWNLQPLTRWIAKVQRDALGRQGRKEWLELYSDFARKNYPLGKDTGAMFEALSTRAKGNYSHAIPNGVEFGFSTTRHPSGKSYRKIAEILNVNLLPPPNQQLVEEMAEAVKKALDRIDG